MKRRRLLSTVTMTFAANVLPPLVTPSCHPVLLSPCPPDSVLLSRARLGDDSAFREIVERYEGAVAGVVIGMLGCGDEADDVGQETFIRFHRALDEFREDSSVRTYLTRIAMNLSLNALKRRRRFSLRFISRDQHDIASAEPTISPDPAADIDERRRVVWRAIRMLSPRHQPVVILRMMQDLSTRETAEALGIPEGTVLSRLARAMRELATTLGPYMRNGMLTEDK